MEHSHDSVRRGACGASVTVAFPGGARVSVEVTDEVASALRDMQRETWRIERREARHTLSLDAMDSFVPSAGPKSEPGFIALGSRRRAGGGPALPGPLRPRVDAKGGKRWRP